MRGRRQMSVSEEIRTQQITEFVVSLRFRMWQRVRQRKAKTNCEKGDRKDGCPSPISRLTKNPVDPDPGAWLEPTP